MKQKLKLTSETFPQGKIPAIKAIREVSGYGLKDAKDLVDRLEQVGEYTVTSWSPLTPADLRVLKEQGISIADYHTPLRDRTKHVLIAAIKNNDCELAKGLFQAWYDSK